MQPSNYISVVVPTFNESEVICEFFARLTAVLDTTNYQYEVLFINDGSSDQTLFYIKELANTHAFVSYINLSRNFGKEAAMSAGLDHADGDAVIFIDADLQDPPELIPQLIEKWKEGYDSVYAQRVNRDSDTVLKRKTAQWFYSVIGSMSRVAIPANAGDFRLISRRSVQFLRELPESNRFMKGLFSWVGLKQTGVEYVRETRAAGSSKFNYWKLWNFAIDGITSFSTLPLRIASYIGICISLFSIVYGAVLIIQTLFYGNPVAGYPSLMVTILFSSGVQLIFLGVIGEYLGRMFHEVKGRPIYLVDSYVKATDLHTLKRNNSEPAKFEHQFSDAI